MRTLEELINLEEPGWDLISTWLENAKNDVEILAKDQARANKEILNTQVTTRSPMGALIYGSGGMLIDHGWLRVLGSGNSRLDRGLSEWNKGKTFGEFGDPPSHLLIADDVLGGYFAMNAGGLGEQLGKVFYLAQDSLEWECLGATYSEFLVWALQGDLELFYKNFRWPKWKEDVKSVGGDQVFAFFPFLWSKEGKEIEKVHREMVAIEEHYRLTMEFQKKMS